MYLLIVSARGFFVLIKYLDRKSAIFSLYLDYLENIFSKKMFFFFVILIKSIIFADHLIEEQWRDSSDG